MFLGIGYIWWVCILIAIFWWLVITSWPKKNAAPTITKEQLDSYISDVLEMRWFKVTSPPEQVVEVLNKIEVAKITVMYQFFLNEKTGLYDLFFRCRRADLDRMKGIMKDFI
jgi:hypothetical protein